MYIPVYMYIYIYREREALHGADMRTRKRHGCCHTYISRSAPLQNSPCRHSKDVR